MAEEELSTRRRGTLSRLPEGLLPAIERLDRSITGVVSPVGITTIGLVTLYYTALSYGLLVIGIVGGRPGLARVVSSSNTHPMLMIIAIPMIPVALVLLEASEVEDKTLSVWRKKISPIISKMPILGSIINYFWPEMKREPFANQNSGGSIIITIDYLARSIASGLMLPFLGYLFGKTLFGKTKLNTFQRTLLGSAMFFTLKVSLKVILKHHQYRRQGFRRVLNYDPSLEPPLSPTPATDETQTMLAPYTPNVVKDFQQVKHVH